MAQEVALTAELEQCIENCQDCHRICHEAISHCLEIGGEYAGLRHIGILMDCADICQTANEFMVRNSEMHGPICGACAAVCDACEAACRQFNDELLHFCAELCARCAASCRHIASSSRPA